MAAAKEYPSTAIRNVVVLGHGGAGKTTLIDALCFSTGTSRRRGAVKEGTALTMHTEEEIGHGISMQASMAYAEWEGTKVNLLDTPGYLDFTGEAIAATRVADGAVVVLGATTGVEVGTEKVWEYTQARGIPRLFVVSMMDKEHANFGKVVQEIKQHMTPKALPAALPIGDGESFRGIVNLFTGKAHIFTGRVLTIYPPFPAGANYVEIRRQTQGGQMLTIGTASLHELDDADLHPLSCRPERLAQSSRGLPLAVPRMDDNQALCRHLFPQGVSELRPASGKRVEDPYWVVRNFSIWLR